MSRPPRKTASQATSGKGRRKGIPDLSAQDGVLGAGTVSSLLVIWQYAMGQKIPTELAGAITPFASLAISYCLAFGKQFYNDQKQQRAKRKYERGVLRILRDAEVSEETKAKVKKEWEEFGYIDLTVQRQQIIESMAVVSASVSDG